MIITLEHEDIENALLDWMSNKGMAADASTTSIAMSKARNSGRITAVIDPNGKLPDEGAQLPEPTEVTPGADASATDAGTAAPEKKLFG
jgi:hypothetical protein